MNSNDLILISFNPTFSLLCCFCIGHSVSRLLGVQAIWDNSRGIVILWQTLQQAHLPTSPLAIMRKSLYLIKHLKWFALSRSIIYFQIPISCLCSPTAKQPYSTIELNVNFRNRWNNVRSVIPYYIRPLLYKFVILEQLMKFQKHIKKKTGRKW